MSSQSARWSMISVSVNANFKMVINKFQGVVEFGVAINDVAELRKNTTAQFHTFGNNYCHIEMITKHLDRHVVTLTNGFHHACSNEVSGVLVSGKSHVVFLVCEDMQYM